MGSEHKDFKGDIDVPESAIQVIDDAVISKLPPGTKATGISAFGASFWTRTARLDTETDGQPKAYFLKTTYGDRGRSMMSGEFTSMSAIHEAMSEFCPRPIAWGSYVSIPNVHFFLCDFHEMTDELPDLQSFPAKLAELHRKGTSQNGKYGFPCRTYHGNTPLDHGWADTWEEYFTTRTKVLLEMEQKAQGPNQEILELSVPFFAKVVPRLLRPLETGRNSIKPSLVHGDLWYGNTSTDADTELPIIYDAACFYAHNEYDLGVWRASWNKLGKPYFNRYFKNFPIAAPEEDHDDRNLLYATRVNILDSILYKGYSGYREKLVSDMRKLVDKFPAGYEGWAAEQEDVANDPIEAAYTGENPPQSTKKETVNEAFNHAHDKAGNNDRQEDGVPTIAAVALSPNKLPGPDAHEISPNTITYNDETLARDPIEAPARERDEAPAIEHDEALAREHNEALDREQDEAQATEHDKAPATEYDEASAREHNEAPAIEQDEAPAREHNEALAREQDEASAREHNEAPATEQDEAPAREHNEALAREHDEASAREHNEAPATEQDEAPAREHNEAPATEHDEASAREHDEASAREHDEASAREHDEASAREQDEAPAIEHDETSAREHNEALDREQDEAQATEHDKAPATGHDEASAREHNEAPAIEHDEALAREHNEALAREQDKASARELNEAPAIEHNEAPATENDEASAREQDELHHNIVLPDLDLGSMHDQTSSVPAVTNPVADLEKEDALAPRTGAEQDSESVELGNMTPVVQPLVALDHRTDFSTSTQQEEQLPAAWEDRPAEAKRNLSNNDMNGTPGVESLKTDVGSLT